MKFHFLPVFVFGRKCKIRFRSVSSYMPVCALPFKSSCAQTLIIATLKTTGNTKQSIAVN